jgi:hypothetical protein
MCDTVPYGIVEDWSLVFAEACSWDRKVMKTVSSPVVVELSNLCFRRWEIEGYRIFRFGWKACDTI